MKRGLLALVVLLCVPPPAGAQGGVSPEARPFAVSSLNTGFATQGDFEGEYRVYADRIELKVTRANIYLSEHCPYKGLRLLSAVKFGLAKGIDGGRWKMLDAGREFLHEQVMRPGDTYDLGELYFDIPRDGSLDLSKQWLVVQMEEYALDIPEERHRPGFAFAHSRRDIFAPARQ